MKHPDLEFVRSVLKPILAKRRFVDWKIESISFAFFPSRYAVVFVHQQERKTVPLVTEFFDDIQNNDTPFTRRKVKKSIQKELLPHDTGEDD